MTLVLSLSISISAIFLHSDLDFYYPGSLNNISYHENPKKRTNLSQYSLTHFIALLRQLFIYFTIFENVKFFEVI